MFYSKLLKIRGGGGAPPTHGKDLPNASGGVDQALTDNQTIQIFVCVTAHRTHALRLGLSDPLADLNTAVQRFGYDLSVDRLCRFGGAPLPPDNRLTVAESGLHANSLSLIHI